MQEISQAGKQELAIAQLELIRDNLKSRHQSVLTILVSSMAVITLVGSMSSSVLKVWVIGGLLVLSLVILWYDIITIRIAIKKSQDILRSQLGQAFANSAEEIAQRTPWYIRNFVELVAAVFTGIVIFLTVIFLYDTGQKVRGNLVPETREFFCESIQTFSSTEYSRVVTLNRLNEIAAFRSKLDQISNDIAVDQLNHLYALDTLAELLVESTGSMLEKQFEFSKGKYLSPFDEHPYESFVDRGEAGQYVSVMSEDISDYQQYQSLMVQHIYSLLAVSDSTCGTPL